MTMQSKDELIIAAMQLVREDARARDLPWSKRIIFSVAGDNVTAWLLAPNGQKFALDTFSYFDVDSERVLELCDVVWAGADKTEPVPPPAVTEEDIVQSEQRDNAHVHSFLEVEYTFPEDVHIGYNGQMFHAKGGCPVKVPQCVLQVWEDAEKERMEALAAMAAALRPVKLMV